MLVVAGFLLFDLGARVTLWQVERFAMKPCSKRIIGLPGEQVSVRLRGGAAFVFVDGERLDEPYIVNSRRDMGPEKTFRVPEVRSLLAHRSDGRARTARRPRDGHVSTGTRS